MRSEYPPIRMTASTEPGHVPVLPEEVLAALDPQPGETFADCTAGLGGHAALIAQRLGPTGRVVLNDLDPANLARAGARIREVLPPDRVVEILGNFADLPRTLQAQGLQANLVLADLGFASTQVDDPARGLSFRREGPLDMRLGPGLPQTAADLVATLPERELADVIWRFGEEKHARAVARKVVAARQESPIQTTRQLAEIVRSAIPRPRGPAPTIDPATRTFQALRIAVNDELGSLDSWLASVVRAASRPSEDGWLAAGARVAVIAFHSLEDRPVKRAFADLAQRGLAEPLFRGVVQASEAEQAANPRSRSAKLRAVRLISPEGGSAG